MAMSLTEQAHPGVAREQMRTAAFLVVSKRNVRSGANKGQSAHVADYVP